MPNYAVEMVAHMDVVVIGAKDEDDAYELASEFHSSRSWQFAEATAHVIPDDSLEQYKRHADEVLEDD